MKFSTAISEIRRGEWLLDIHNIEAYYPLIDNLLNGRNLDFMSAYSPDPLALHILDKYGMPLPPREDGSVEIPRNSIAQVDMVGEIMKYGDWCTVGADEIVGELRKAESFKNADATILKVDGPGGSVKAIGPFLDFAKTKKKPIVGLADDALSLHFWTLVGLCDYVIADNAVSARFGSVGVVISFLDNTEALKKAGIIRHEIYPDESADKNLAFTLAREGKYDKIKEEHLSPLAKKFQAAVRERRPALKEAPGVLTGKTFYADEALSLGMIDAIGGMDLAMEVARKLAFRNSFPSTF